MADSKISALTAVAAAALANELAVNEAGTSKKITVQQILDAVDLLAAAATPVGTDTMLLIQSGVAKEVTVNQLQSFVFTGGDYAPGSFTVLTGSFALMVKSLILTSTQQVVLQGTARLRID